MKVATVVSDRAVKMAGMGKVLKSQRPDIHTYGCQAHFMNLLANDVAQNNATKPVNSKIVVVKQLQNNYACSAAAKQRKTPRTPLPTEVRWNSLKETLKYFVHHWSDIADVINTNLKPGDRVYRFMEELSFKRSATDQLTVLNPASADLNQFQADNCLPGDVFEIWRDLRANIPDEYQEDVAKRSLKALSEVFLAANLLDPRYQGINMYPADMQSATKYIQEVDLDSGEELMKYLARYPLYLKSVFGDVSTITSPGEWWKAGVRLGFNAKFADIADNLFSAVPISAGLERHFSTMGMSYGTLRYRLGVEKARKLCFLYKQLNK